MIREPNNELREVINNVVVPKPVLWLVTGLLEQAASSIVKLAIAAKLRAFFFFFTLLFLTFYLINLASFKA